MEIRGPRELEQVVEDGHAVVLFHATHCTYCNSFFPVWIRCADKLTFLNPKWRFYIMNEQKAETMLNRLRIYRFPKVVVFDCPAEHKRPQEQDKDKVLVQTASGIQRLAYPLTFLPDRREPNVLRVLRPFVEEACVCFAPGPMAPIQGSHTGANKASDLPFLTQTYTALSDAASSTPPGATRRGTTPARRHVPALTLLRETLSVAPLVSRTATSWIRDTIIFAQNPVAYWKANQRPLVQQQQSKAAM